MELAREQSAVYKDSNTYLVFKVTLVKPLIPKRSAESVAASVAELIPLQVRNPGMLGLFRCQAHVHDSGVHV